MMETDVRFIVLRSTGRYKWVVRRLSMSNGVPSHSDLKSFEKKEKAIEFKKKQEGTI